MSSVMFKCSNVKVFSFTIRNTARAVQVSSASSYAYCLYSWLSLSRTRLSRITAYLEVKILSLPKHENLTTSKKYCGKEKKLLPSFPQYFRYISNVKSPITYKFVKCGCSNYFFLNSENLICRGTDISKCFRESLGIPEQESMYMYMAVRVIHVGVKLFAMRLSLHTCIF